jgi:hypothetical protein
MVQLENCWMDLDEMGVDLMPLGVHPKIAFFSFLQLVIPIWQVNKLEREIDIRTTCNRTIH